VKIKKLGHVVLRVRDLASFTQLNHRGPWQWPADTMCTLSEGRAGRPTSARPPIRDVGPRSIDETARRAA
jgi:hypothetical protein